MLPGRRSFGALRVALCCLLTLCGVTWCAAESVSVSGQVVDTKGNPVPGVKVRLAVVASKPPFAAVHEASQVSGKSGEYSLGPVDVGESYEIMVAAYEPGKWIGWASYGATQTGPQELVVSKPTVTTGVIVDENGRPMSGAKVGYERFSSGMEPLRNALAVGMLTWLHPLKTFVTGVDGKYRLPDVPSYVVVTPFVSKEWYGLGDNSLGTNEGNKRIVMVPAGGVTGRVLGPDGHPCPGAEATACNQDSIVGPGYAGSDGVFRIDGIPPGVYDVACSAADGPAVGRKGVQVKAGTVTDLGDIALPPSVEMSGRVLDAATGKPIRGAKVSAYGDGFHAGETISGANGEYKLATFPGKITLYYEGGVPFYLRESFQPVEMTVPAEGIHDYDIRITRADQAHGKVLSATGKPVAGAIVNIGGVWRGVRTVTDSSGRFTIVVPEDEQASDSGNLVTLQAKEKKPNGQGGFTYIERDKLIKNGVTITLAPAKSVNVRVVDKAGKPIAGARVSMNVRVDRSCYAVSAWRTDKRGRASLSGAFRDGSYSFQALCAGYIDFSDPDEGVDSSSAEWKPVRKIVMTKADQVKGTVVDSEGKPAVGVTVTRLAHHDCAEVTTDVRGAFSLFLPPKGESSWTSFSMLKSDPAKERTNLMVEDGARSLGAYVSADRATAVAKGVRIVIKPPYDLQVIVRDTSGKPIAGATVDGTGSWLAGPNRPTTDGDGIAKLSVYEGVQATAAAEMVGYVYMGEPLSLPAAGSKMWTGKCEVILTPLTRTVEGQVLDVIGKPIKGACISTKFGQDAPIIADADGRFKIDLPDMMVPLSASADGRQGSANVGRDDKTVTITVSDE